MVAQCKSDEATLQAIFNLSFRWYSHYQSLPEEAKGQTIALAVTKLSGGASHPGPYASLAALDSRVLIDFDPVLSRKTQNKLVKSYMRCIFNIPRDREYVSSGYPSEPMLSEAAGHILTSSAPSGPSIVDKAPDVLEDSLQSGLLVAKGQRGELVARTLLTVAHDLAALNTYPRLESEPQFHRPILLIDLLKNLLAPPIWEEVRHATPYDACEGDVELEVAFANTWVNFSHFIRLGGQESLNVETVTELLKRGAAIRTCDLRIGFGVPLHNGDPSSTIISPERTSIAQFRATTAKDPTRVFPNLDLIETCDDDLPILSVSMQLRAEGPNGSRVEIQMMQEDDDIIASDTSSSARVIARRHYSIVLYGCTSDTYSCIGNNGPKYQNLLRSELELFQDYPRKEVPGFLEAVHMFKSRLYSNNPTSMCWQD